MNKTRNTIMRGHRSPPQYLESVTACGPATKHVLYVEVVPKGFLKVENMSDSEDQELRGMKDPLMTITHPSSPPLPIKKEKMRNLNLERPEQGDRKHEREKDERLSIKTVKNEKCKTNNVSNNEYNCNYIKKETDDEGMYENYPSPSSNLPSFPSPARSVTPDRPVTPNKKPERRKCVKKMKKRDDVDHTSSAFKCNRSKCVFTTLEITELNRHKKEDHKGRKDFQCDQCTYRGATASDLRKHYRQHSGEIPYTCKYEGCEFKARHNNSLVYHTSKYHPSGEPLRCDAPTPTPCSFTTYLRAALKHHKMMRHGGGKSLACEVCPYKCYLMADLRKHLRVHTGESPYVCDFQGCRYACKISSNLKKHKRIHTEEKPYVCDSCHFRTNFINSLKVHKRTHTNERPYFCDQCGYRCNHTSNLKKHVARLHPNASYTIIKKPLLVDTSDIS